MSDGGSTGGHPVGQDTTAREHTDTTTTLVDSGDTATIGAGLSFTGGTPRLPLRRGSADPVKLLLHRHRELCGSAVDALEIAAGLEAHGITDQAALTRFRHRDVFALAEELYARVPRTTDVLPGRPAERFVVDDDHPSAPGGPGTGRRWPVVTLFPGVIAALTLTALEHTEGQTCLALTLAGVLAWCGVVAVCLRRGPLRVTGRTVRAGGLWGGWLLMFPVCGEGLLDALVRGGPTGPWPVTLTPLVTLSFALAPAAWCAHLLTARARSGLHGGRDLAAFAAGLRPPLLLGVVLYACVLTGFSVMTARVFHAGAETAPTVALGTLLLLARLLTARGFPDAAATGLAAACIAETLACVSVLLGRLPGLDALAVPVAEVVRLHGAWAVPTVACAVAGVGLLLHAVVTLTRASAHT